MLHDYSPEKLRNLRKRAMMTQSQVLEQTGFCKATLSDLELGRTRPQTRTLEKLLNLYAVRIQYQRNMKAVFEERFNGGYIPGETVIGFGSPGLHAIRVEEKAAHERAIPASHGLPRVSRRP